MAAILDEGRTCQTHYIKGTTKGLFQLSVVPVGETVIYILHFKFFFQNQLIGIQMIKFPNQMAKKSQTHQTN